MGARRRARWVLLVAAGAAGACGGVKPAGGGAGAGAAGTAGGGAGVGNGGAAGAAAGGEGAAAGTGGGAPDADGPPDEAPADGPVDGGGSPASDASDARPDIGPGPMGVGWGELTISGTELPAGVPTTMRVTRFPYWTASFDAQTVIWAESATPGGPDKASVSVPTSFTDPLRNVLLFVTRDGAGNVLSAVGPPTGITQDKLAHKVTFKSVKLTDMKDPKAPWTFVLDGELRYSDFAPRPGTTVKAADLSACPTTSPTSSIDVGAPFSDIACAVGVYGGTTDLAGTCTVTVDGAARTIRYVTEGLDVTLGYRMTTHDTNLGPRMFHNLRTTSMGQLWLDGLDDDFVSIVFSPQASGYVPANRTVIDLGYFRRNVIDSHCRILLP